MGENPDIDFEYINFEESQFNHGNNDDVHEVDDDYDIGSMDEHGEQYDDMGDMIIPEYEQDDHDFGHEDSYDSELYHKYNEKPDYE